jgi:hypothetical protein
VGIGHSVFPATLCFPHLFYFSLIERMKDCVERKRNKEERRGDEMREEHTMPAHLRRLFFMKVATSAISLLAVKTDSFFSLYFFFFALFLFV